MKRVRPVCCITLFFVAIGAGGAFAKSSRPTGEEIARAAKTLKLDRQTTATAQERDKKVTITLADFSGVKNRGDLENGYVAGVIDVKGTPGLPDGRYNLFLLKKNQRWHALFESGGRIIKQDDRVEIRSTKSHAERIRPIINLLSGGICLPSPPHPPIYPYEIVCVHLD